MEPLEVVQVVPPTKGTDKLIALCRDNEVFMYSHQPMPDLLLSAGISCAKFGSANTPGSVHVLYGPGMKSNFVLRI